MSNYTKGEKFLLKYTYDFARDGGAVGAITLTPDINALSTDLVVLNGYMIQKTAVASAGSPTLTLGNTTDPDGFMADVIALLATKNAICFGEVAGALVFDDTNDHIIAYCPSVANDLVVSITIGTAALTAGKLDVYLECMAK